MSALDPLSGAEKALAAASTVGEVKELYDVAEAYRVYASSAEEQNRAAVFKLRAGAKGGRMLRADPELGKGKSSRLADLFRGLSASAREHLSKRWQILSRLEDAGSLDAYLADPPAEITMAELLRRANATEREEQANDRAAAEPPPLEQIDAASVVYVDPPWRYEHAKTSNRRIENHYPTMTLEEICALGSRIPAAADSVLLMWATSPKLAEALSVVAAWQFEYRTCMVWVKESIGMGYYARQRHELLLIAARGQLPVPTPSRRPDSVIVAPAGEHSVKPPMHDLIDSMWPGLPKVELFARQSLDRSWWSTWGNDNEVA